MTRRELFGAVGAVAAAQVYWGGLAEANDSLAWPRGSTWQGPYPSQRFRVLGTVEDLAGEVVVVGEWQTPGWNLAPGAVFAMRAIDLRIFWRAA